MTPVTAPSTFEKPTGLSAEQVVAARKKYGSNRLSAPAGGSGWRLAGEIVSEPMFLLLAAASALYIVLGEWQEGIVLGVAMVLVAGISVYQSVRSDRALQALRKLTRPTASVMRAGQLLSSE